MTFNRFPDLKPVADFELSRLKIDASINFIKITAKTKERAAFSGGQQANWTRNRIGGGGSLSLQNPNDSDLLILANKYPDSTVLVISLSIDLWPKDVVSKVERDSLLNRTMAAVAARFRPSDAFPYSQRPESLPQLQRIDKPAHHPLSGESPLRAELRYGHRKNWVQAHVYPMVSDHTGSIVERLHRVRIQLTFQRGYLIDLGVERPQHLFTANWLKECTHYFRMVARPEIRVEKFTEEQLGEAQKHMVYSWRLMGASAFLKSQVIYKSCTLPLGFPFEAVRLVPYEAVNKIFITALMNIEKRMTSKYTEIPCATMRFAVT